MVRIGGWKAHHRIIIVAVLLTAVTILGFSGMALAEEPDPSDADSEITISEPPEAVAPGQEFSTDVSFNIYSSACGSFTISLYEVDKGSFTTQKTKIAEHNYPNPVSNANRNVIETVTATISQTTLDGDGDAELKAVIIDQCRTGFKVSSDTFSTAVTEPPENDQFEQNDDSESAHPITEDTFSNNRGQITPRDTDWYKISVSGGETLSADYAARNENGELQMEIFAPDGDGGFLSASGSTATIPSIPESGTAYIALTGETDSTTASYSLDVTRKAPENDPFEDNDQSQSAAPIKSGNYDQLKIVPADTDWFKLPADKGGTLSVDLKTTLGSDSEKVQMTVFTPNGEGGFTRHTGLSATVNSIDESGTAYIAVTGESEADTAKYALDVDHKAPQNDNFEANDQYQAAASVSDSTYDNLRITPGDLDWYSVGISQGETLETEIQQTEGDGKLLMAAYVPDGNGGYERISGAGATTDSAPVSGTAYIGVTAKSESTVATYSLVVDIESPPENDRLEPNDDYQSASEIDSGSYSELQITPADIDWYKIEVSEGDTVSASLTETTNTGDLVIQFSYPDGNGDFETVRRQEFTLDSLPAAGTAYVAVTAEQNSTTATYELNLNIEEPPENDGYEANNDYQSAAPINSGSYTDLQITAADTDWYSVDVTKGESISAALTESTSTGDLVMQLSYPDGNGDFETIEQYNVAVDSLPASGTAYVAVTAKSDETTATYSLNITLD